MYLKSLQQSKYLAIPSISISIVATISSTHTQF